MINNNICKQYDNISDWFDQHRDKEGLMEKEYLDLMVFHLPVNGSILDLGCGTGQPIAQFFIELGYTVTGVDGSIQMIDKCRQRFPTQDWIVDDMRTISLSSTFDLVLTWHSLFHLTHIDQCRMFKRVATMLKPGGVFAFTGGPQHGEIFSDNGGENLYHASLSIGEYQEQLNINKFKILLHKVEDPQCGNSTCWVVQKIN